MVSAIAAVGMKRVSYSAVLLISLLTGYVVLGAGSRPTATPRPATTIITPAYPSRSVFDQVVQTHLRPSHRLGNNIRGLIVNHHLIASDFIVDTLSYAQSQSIERIILLAPNHFYRGYGQLTTTHESLLTPYGVVTTDRRIVQALARQGIVVDDRAPFIEEHGIFSILPFLRLQHPTASIVPIITKATATDSQVDAVAEQLRPFITSRTLIIASLDFAHNQTNSGADALDQRTLNQLALLDVQTSKMNHDGLIAVDSPPTLRLLFQLMRQQHAMSFRVTHHANSAIETGQRDSTDVTSHITGLFTRWPIVLHYLSK
jgi:AmmeMemoRadiSam system protein B